MQSAFTVFMGGTMERRRSEIKRKSPDRKRAAPKHRPGPLEIW
jgi:hypothetical protein